MKHLACDPPVRGVSLWRWFGAALLALTVGAAPLAAQDAKDEIPPPEDISLEAKDGVQLRATWYAGTKGKKSVPVMIVHGWDGQRSEYDALARLLQSVGHAVIVPDLRGHGQSTVRKLPNGQTETLDRSSFRANDLGAMTFFDLEAVKAHLMAENNKGELNIELLCVVGVDTGAIVAVNWVMKDWSWPQLPTYKQGQDVKAMVLISPVQTFKGASFQQALAHPIVRSRISTFIVTGKNDRTAYTDARRVFTSLSRYHTEPKPEEVKDKKTLFISELDTSLQGPKLLAARGLNVDRQIASFIELRLVNKADENPWTDRRPPFGN